MADADQISQQQETSPTFQQHDRPNGAEDGQSVLVLVLVDKRYPCWVTGAIAIESIDEVRPKSSLSLSFLEPARVSDASDAMLPVYRPLSSMVESVGVEDWPHGSSPGMLSD